MERRRGPFDCPSGLLIGTGSLVGARVFWRYPRAEQQGVSLSLALVLLGWPAHPVPLADVPRSYPKQTPSAMHTYPPPLSTQQTPSLPPPPTYFPPFPFPPSLPSPSPPPPPFFSCFFFFFFPPPNISKCPALSANARSVFPVNPAVYFYTVAHTPSAAHTLPLSPLSTEQHPISDVPW